MTNTKSTQCQTQLVDNYLLNRQSGGKVEIYAIWVRLVCSYGQV